MATKKSPFWSWFENSFMHGVMFFHIAGLALMLLGGSWADIVRAYCIITRSENNGRRVKLYFNDPFGCYPYKNKQSGEGVLYLASQFPADDGKGTEKKYHTLSYK